MTSPRKLASWDVQTQQFLLPKSIHTQPECEDAIGINLQANRFAVADGATEAFDAGNWARQLAHNWVQIKGRLTADDFWSWLEKEGRQLTDSWSRLQLPWYAEEKSGTGSFAAFVGVELELESRRSRWRAIALGDSCLLHCRNDVVIRKAPCVDSTSFGSAPVLAPSRTAPQQRALQDIVVDTGELLRGDTLLLMSDAIAAWYLWLVEANHDDKRWQFLTLLNGENEELLSEFLIAERSAGSIKDDDVAIVKIEV